MIDLFERVAGEEIDVPVPCVTCGLPAYGNDICASCYEATPTDNFSWDDVEDSND